MGKLNTTVEGVPVYLLGDTAKMLFHKLYSWDLNRLKELEKATSWQEKSAILSVSSFPLLEFLTYHPNSYLRSLVLQQTQDLSEWQRHRLMFLSTGDTDKRVMEEMSLHYDTPYKAWEHIVSKEHCSYSLIINVINNCQHPSILDKLMETLEVHIIRTNEIIDFNNRASINGTAEYVFPQLQLYQIDDAYHQIIKSRKKPEFDWRIYHSSKTIFDDEDGNEAILSDLAKYSNNLDLLKHIWKNHAEWLHKTIRTNKTWKTYSEQLMIEFNSELENGELPLDWIREILDV